ncbi:MAG TPA: type II toxin-antitoxin system VapC family toxin [Terriglobales bacterium]
MKLLLDTHIWLWAYLEPRRLRPHLLRELRNPANELWLSPISTWEALTLHAKGRIRLPDDIDDWLHDATLPLREAPLTHEIALAASRLSLHPDPADRFLAATAQVLDLILATADKRLLGIAEIRTMGNH